MVRWVLCCVEVCTAFIVDPDILGSAGCPRRETSTLGLELRYTRQCSLIGLGDNRNFVYSVMDKGRKHSPNMTDRSIAGTF